MAFSKGNGPENPSNVLPHPRGSWIRERPPESDPFAFTPKHLAKLHDPKDLSALRALGGIEGLLLGLRTNANKGLPSAELVLYGKVTMEDALKASGEQLQTKGDQVDVPGNEREPELSRESRTDIAAPLRRISTMTLSSTPPPFQDRKRVFSSNQLPRKRSKNLFQLMWLMLQDRVLVRPYESFLIQIILCVVAVVSLALGFYQSFRPGATDKVEWVEGVAILIAVAVITVVQALNDYQKERKFQSLYKKVCNPVHK